MKINYDLSPSPFVLSVGPIGAEVEGCGSVKPQLELNRKQDISAFCRDPSTAVLRTYAQGERVKGVFHEVALAQSIIEIVQLKRQLRILHSKQGLRNHDDDPLAPSGRTRNSRRR